MMKHPPFRSRQQRRTKFLSLVTMSISLNLLLLRPSATKYYAKAFTATTPQIRSLAFSSSSEVSRSIIGRSPRHNELYPISSSSSSSSSSISVVLGSCHPFSSSSFKDHHHEPNNKFSRLRSQIAATHKLMASASPTTTSTITDDEGLIESKLSIEEEGLDVARKAISLLAQTNKTWKRLAPLIELDAAATATASDGNNNNERNTIADIGCDHGLLSIALAASGRYKGVVGVDVSSRALEDGALLFYKKMKVILGGDTYRYHSLDSLDRGELLDLILPVQFRVGDGLAPLFSGEADSICIAGVGVHTILSILMSRQHCGSDGDDDDDVSQGNHDEIEAYDIDRIKCNRLLLQPTNSRPRHLIKLYRELHDFGFVVKDERVVYLSSRWYITSAFERVTTDAADGAAELQFPGSILAARGDVEFNRYVKHHSDWLESDVRRNANLDQDDVQWLEHIQAKQ